MSKQFHLRPRRSHRWWWIGGAVMLLAVAGIATVFVVSGGSHHPAPVAKPAPPAGPDQMVAAYLAAWSKGDWAAMANHVDQPPADFAGFHQQMMASLLVTSATYTMASAPQVNGEDGTVTYRAHLRLRGLGDWDFTNALPLVRRGGTWLVSWTPQTLSPDLAEGRQFARTRMLPARGEILGRDGSPLTFDVAMVGIGIEPSHVQDRATVVATLAQALGIDPARINAALSAPGVRPDQFVPIQQVTDAAFQPLKPVLSPVPGIVFEHLAVRQAATPDLEAHVIGRFGQVTAEELAKLGDLYLPGDSAGLSGVESAFEHVLRGTPSGEVQIVDSNTGGLVRTVKTFTGTPGQSVTTTLDLPTQIAAEQALDGVTQPAAMVVVQPSTGDILAVVARPVTGADRALESVYPPGSTFKVITSAALLASGVTPDQQTTCPPTVTVDGESFKNFEGEAEPSLPFHRAFAISCNTAFVQLADKLSSTQLSDAAREFGFNVPPSVGVPIASSSYPPPRDSAERVASAIGQARVAATPLEMATVAAAVDAGVWRPPHLAGPAPPDPGVPPLPAGVVQTLRTLMAEVVASGTGTLAAVPGGAPVAGKTGTAEFGTSVPLMTHAWFIGFRGDLAFSVLVEGGGVGGRVAAPLAARFLVNLAAPHPTTTVLTVPATVP